MSIVVVGLGLDVSQLTLGAAGMLKSGGRVILRTGQCAAKVWLDEQDVSYETLDALYETAEDFDALNESLVNHIMEASKDCDVVYGVLDVRDESVSRLMRSTAGVRVMPGVSTDGMLGAMDSEPTMTLAAADWGKFQCEASVNALVREIDSPILAGEVKLKLMQRYPAEHPIVMVCADGTVINTVLSELDHLKQYNHCVCAFIGAQTDLCKLERYGVGELAKIMHILRAPGGCPWDRAQTHKSLTTNMVEEAWEAVDAIDRDDIDALYDELGDVLLQVVLHSEIAEQFDEFTLDDVSSAVCKKLIARHPHVFANVTVSGVDAERELWEQVKRKEREIKTRQDLMDSVTHSLPALMRAEKVIGRAERECGKAEGVLEALKAQVAAFERGAIDEKMIGRALWQLVWTARQLEIHPEMALNQQTEGFISRFIGEIDVKE